MAAMRMHVLKPSVNNLTARIFVRAAGLDCEEIDAWGNTGTDEFLAMNPSRLTPGDRGVRTAPRRAVGELRADAVPVQQARPRPVLPARPGRARDGGQRDVLPHRHALPAAGPRHVPGARLPAVPGRGRLVRRRRRREGRRPAGRGRRARDAARGVPLVLPRRPALHRRRPPLDRRHPPRGVAGVPRGDRLRAARLDAGVHGRDGVRRSATPTPSRPATCAATSPT